MNDSDELSTPLLTTENDAASQQHHDTAWNSPLDDTPKSPQEVREHAHRLLSAAEAVAGKSLPQSLGSLSLDGSREVTRRRRDDEKESLSVVWMTVGRAVVSLKRRGRMVYYSVRGRFVNAGNDHGAEENENEVRFLFVYFVAWI